MGPPGPADGPVDGPVDGTASDDAGSPVPTCFRHPGKETYVSCVRCGRHACPDCLRSAPVGQQCVECIRAESQGSRQVRTVFGGRVAAGAVVTWTLVCVNVALYLAEWAYPSIVADLEMVGRFPLAPLAPLLGVADGQWYRLITSAFLHEPGLSGIGPAHILFNMWALVVVGPALEQSLGRLRYLALYLLSALGGSVLIYFIGQADAPSLGASGAIFGLFGAWFVVSRRLRLDSRGIIVLIVLNLAISFAIPHVAWQAHLGGLVTGGALTAAYAYAPRKQRMAVQAAATVAVLVLLVIAVVVRNHQLASPAF